MRPPRPCLEPGCPVLVQQGRCPTHQRAYDARRPTVKERGYSGPEHRSFRASVLERDPACRGCHAPGRKDDHADHVIRITDQGARLDPANGQRLCRRCHAYKTAREERDPWFGQRLRDAAPPGEPTPWGWRSDPQFGGRSGRGRGGRPRGRSPRPPKTVQPLRFA